MNRKWIAGAAALAVMSCSEKGGKKVVTSLEITEGPRVVAPSKATRERGVN